MPDDTTYTLADKPEFTEELTEPLGTKIQNILDVNTPLNLVAENTKFAHNRLPRSTIAETQQLLDPGEVVYIKSFLENGFSPNPLINSKQYTSNGSAASGRGLRCCCTDGVYLFSGEVHGNYRINMSHCQDSTIAIVQSANRTDVPYCMATDGAYLVVGCEDKIHVYTLPLTAGATPSLTIGIVNFTVRAITIFAGFIYCSGGGSSNIVACCFDLLGSLMWSTSGGLSGRSIAVSPDGLYVLVGYVCESSKNLLILNGPTGVLETSLLLGVDDPDNTISSIVLVKNRAFCLSSEDQTIYQFKMLRSLDGVFYNTTAEELPLNPLIADFPSAATPYQILSCGEQLAILCLGGLAVYDLRSLDLLYFSKFVSTDHIFVNQVTGDGLYYYFAAQSTSAAVVWALFSRSNGMPARVFITTNPTASEYRYDPIPAMQQWAKPLLSY